MAFTTGLRPTLDQIRFVSFTLIKTRVLFKVDVYNPDLLRRCINARDAAC